MWRKAFSVAAVVGDVLLLLFLALGLTFELGKAGHITTTVIVVVLSMAFISLNILAIGFGARLPQKPRPAEVAAEFS